MLQLFLTIINFIIVSVFFQIPVHHWFNQLNELDPMIQYTSAIVILNNRYITLREYSATENFSFTQEKAKICQDSAG